VVVLNKLEEYKFDEILVSFLFYDNMF